MKKFINEDKVWEVLPKLKNIILILQKELSDQDYHIRDNIYIAKNASIDSSVKIDGPAIIGPNTILKHNAYIRSNVVIGSNCTIGNSCELKNSILFDEVSIPHLSYVGDSILGYQSHLGAGVKISNSKLDQSLIKIKFTNDFIDTNLDKFGAIISDKVSIGCNSVTNPGTIIGFNTTVYPLVNIGGVIEENSIYKNNDTIIKKIASDIN